MRCGSPCEATGPSRAGPPFCPPLPPQEGTRHFQGRSLGCIRKSWQGGFRVQLHLGQRGTSIWILFAVPWQESLSRTVGGKWSGGGDGSPRGPGPAWALVLPLTCWATSGCSVTALILVFSPMTTMTESMMEAIDSRIDLQMLLLGLSEMMRTGGPR